MKSNKGITLVALVITIIVLLILAGVSISLVVGDNGIMTRAKNAAEQTNKADAKSAFELAVSSLTAEFYSAKYTGEGTVTESTAAAHVHAKIKDELEKAGYTGTMSSADSDGTIVVKKYPEVTGDTGVSISYKISNDEITSITFTP